LKILLNRCLNRMIRMLDGQWQGTRIASDGMVYFFAGSHHGGLSAALLRYDPMAGAASGVEMIARDISAVCGEDCARTPSQGKVHSELLEHEGRLYFGTHLSDYTPEGMARYTGGHLVSYELASERFRDYGVIHPNFTNYAGLSLDAARRRIYYYSTRFFGDEGPHVHRIDIDSGRNEDLGEAPVSGNGRSSMFHFSDRQGDCWFTVEREGALFVARGESGKIERHAGALPKGAAQWHCVRTLDGDRALAALPDGFYIFDSRRFDGTASAFEPLAPVDTPGFAWCYTAFDRDRFWWTSRTRKPKPGEERYGVRIYSAPWNDPRALRDHGPIIDAEGHHPWYFGDLVSDGNGRLYAVGRWYVHEHEFDAIGVDRKGLKCSVYFTVFDVADEQKAVQ
jgi:hypothetical protein